MENDGWIEDQMVMAALNLNKNEYVLKLFWKLSLGLSLCLFTKSQFAQTNDQSRVKGNAELARLGIRVGQSQEVVRAKLTAAGYPAWNCSFSDDYVGTHTANCSTTVWRGLVRVKGIDANFEIYKLYRDRNTGEIVKVRTDKLVMVRGFVFVNSAH